MLKRFYNNIDSIKADWASIDFSSDGGIIVSLNLYGRLKTIYYSSRAQLKEALSNKKIIVRKWIVAVPRSLCIQKPYNLPAANLKEATQMLEFEIPSLFPIPADQMVYGCTILNSHNQLMDILVCALKKERLNDWMEPLDDLKIDPRKNILSSMAIQQWFISQKPEINVHPTILVAADASQCQIISCINGTLHKSHALASGKMSPHDFCQHIVQTIIHHFEDFSDTLRPKTLLAVACPKTFYSSICDNISPEIKELDRANLFHVDLPSFEPWQPGNADAELNKDNLGFTTIVTSGSLEIILAGAYPHFNLLPQDHLKRQHRKALATNYLIAGATSFLILFLLWLSLAGMNWRAQRLCNKIEAEIAPIKNVAQGIETKRRQIKAIHNQLANHGLISKIIQEFYEFTPSQITLSELNYTVQPNGSSIQIKGQADILSNAFGYTEALKKASILNALQIEDAQQVVKPGGSVVEFRAKCNFKNR